MARTLTWTTSALLDLKAIADYLLIDAPQYALPVIDELLAIETSILDFPEIGRVLPGQDDPAVRERFVHRYRVIYRIDAQQISIVAVVHGSRLLQNALAGREP